MNSIQFPLLARTNQNSVISTTLNDLSNWSRLSSLWPLLYGTSCCFIEFASLIGSRFDFDRYGLDEPKLVNPILLFPASAQVACRSDKYNPQGRISRGTIRTKQS